MSTWQETERRWTEALLDQLAEHFDEGLALSPDYLIEVDDFYISARALLQRIRFHEALGRV